MSGDAPPRKLLSAPKYELSLIYDSDEIGLSGFNHLKIAEYKYHSGSFVRNEKYLPACLTINSNVQVLERFKKSGMILKTIHDNGILLSRELRDDRRPDVHGVSKWIEAIVMKIAQSLWSYNDLLIQQSPHQSIVFFKDFGQYILTVTDLYEGNSFLKSGAKTQRQHFRNLADPNFNSDDLRTAFDRIDAALRALHLWMKSLRETFRQGRVITVEELG